MGRHFEGTKQAELDATPEQIWQAIATGPGIDSWFMGRNQVEGGVVRMAFGGYNPELTVTVNEPLQRFAYRTDEGRDGRFIAYEFLIEGRESGSAVLRMVVSGFLPGDDWEAEYEAMTKGGDLFFRTLVECLTHFPGRTATPVTAFGPPVADWTRAWSKLRTELGLGSEAAEGDHVRFTRDGLEPAEGPIEGVVYFANSQTIGVRAPGALYRFLQGFHGAMVVAHNIFAEVDQQRTEQGWQRWLDRVFS